MNGNNGVENYNRADVENRINQIYNNASKREKAIQYLKKNPPFNQVSIMSTKGPKGPTRGSLRTLHTLPKTSGGRRKSRRKSRRQRKTRRR